MPNLKKEKQALMRRFYEECFMKMMESELMHKSYYISNK